ncbi:Uncharacterised protein [Salmonella enterica subsp. enterica serovar Bovismorbificans]|nr:Uncharacterised protein [Salmonella enterica subsp. enterica serovar Bovismorbificans]CNV03436.1 Uncharacterised protein [Salmonella enterica subsp. enterica serovar Bovismorbificans]
MGRRSRWRHDAVNGGIDKTDVLFNPGFIAICQRIHYVAFQLRGAAHHIFAGDDIQRGIHALRLTFYQPFSDSRSDTLKHHRAHGSGD